MYKWAFFILIGMSLIGCKGTRGVSGSGNVEDLATSQLINQYYASTPSFNTLSSRLRIRYEDKKNRQSVSVTLRMEKDKTIWMNASFLGFPVAKAMVTPDRVAYYEKVKRTYFEGDFSLLSEYFGVDMNFEQLQRLLLGETVFDLRKGKYDVANEDNTYVLTPKKQLDILELFFFINPETYNLSKQRVRQPKDNLSLDVTYNSFQEVNQNTLPENLLIEVNEPNDKTTIDIDFKNIELNKSLNFSFKIPSGYKPIDL